MTQTVAHLEATAAMLDRLCAETATGEIVAASDDGEIHFYLQNGRIAWATSSTARYGFTRHLVEIAGIDRASIREALKAQVREALNSLDQVADGRALFLPRGEAFSQYDVQLTFDLTELRTTQVEPPKAAEGQTGG